MRPQLIGMINELKRLYKMRDVETPTDNLHDEICQIYTSYVEKLFDEIGITWNDVLFWFLADEMKLKSIPLDSEDKELKDLDSLMTILLPERLGMVKGDWKHLTPLIPQPSPRNLRITAYVCTVFSQLSGYSLWHMARQSSIALQHLETAIQQAKKAKPVSSKFSYRERHCRICHE